MLEQQKDGRTGGWHGSRGRSKRWAKQQMNRLMRRQGKKDPEFSIRKKKYRGWD